jgi:hypothetical protein
MEVPVKSIHLTMNRALRQFMAGALCLALVAAGGCATRGGTGALAGGGMGALIGQAIGRNTAGTLIGAGVGTGLGYIIGNEMDKRETRQRTIERSEEVQPLAGTSWQLISVNPEPVNRFKSLVMTFRADGTLLTQETGENGQVRNSIERYRILGDTLIINQPNYVINARYEIKNSQLVLIDQNFRSVLQRIGR